MIGYLKKIWSGTEDASSKRFNGTIGFLMIQFIILFAVIYEYIKLKAISPILVGLVETDLFISASLLGISAVADGVKNKLSK